MPKENPGKKYSIKESSFYSKGTLCAANLYLPIGIEKPPIIVMAHGFGAEMDAALPAFASRFAEKGIAVFMFDYRNFGKSDGKPRNLINPFRHLHDWEAALKHIRKFDNIETKKIALWGTSFSGGHVVRIASKDPDIAAVVSQVPFVSGIAALSVLEWKNIVKGLWAGVRDIFRLITFRDPYYIPIVAEPEKFAAINKPDALEGFLSLLPEESTWENKCPARISLLIGFYNPAHTASRIKCPVLVINAEKDSLFKKGAVKKALKNIRNVEIISFDCGHFEPYSGELFDKVAKIEADFFRKNLSL